MVNNNDLIAQIENKKPVELVQELKDEYKVPSYEEFMKTYKSDDNLNYDDLKGGSVDEVKGYGPCTDGRSESECPHSKQELLDKLKELQNELEDLRDRLSNANGTSMTIIKESIIIVQKKIKIILVIIGSRYPSATPCVDLIFRGSFSGFSGNLLSGTFTGASNIFNFGNGGMRVCEFLGPGFFSNEIKISDIEKLRRFQTMLSRQSIVIAKLGLQTNPISVLMTRSLASIDNDVEATTSCLRKVDGLIRN